MEVLLVRDSRPHFLIEIEKGEPFSDTREPPIPHRLVVLNQDEIGIVRNIHRGPLPASASSTS